MRCIEITDKMRNSYDSFKFNNNMRCIEISFRRRNRSPSNWFNNNMRCIEMIKAAELLAKMQGV